MWFDDGNIVLVASDSEIAFRIYRGLLAAQSTVFSDMFASSTSSPDETFDGCPVVYLSDSPYDLAHLLRVLLPTLQRKLVPKILEVKIRSSCFSPSFSQLSPNERGSHTDLRRSIRYHSPSTQVSHPPGPKPSPFFPSRLPLHQLLQRLLIPHPPRTADRRRSRARHRRCQPRPPHRYPIHAPARPIPVRVPRGHADRQLEARGWDRRAALRRGLPAVLRHARVVLANERFFIVSRILDPTTRTAKCRKPSRCRASLHSAHARAMSREAVRAKEEGEGACDGVLRDWKQPI